MPDQPADLLTAAAEILRSAATGAIHGGRTTWTLGNTLRNGSPVVVDDAAAPTVLIETWAQRLEAVNEYLTRVPPTVGLAVANWLEREAEIWAQCETTKAEIAPKGFKLSWGINTHDEALAVARAVLGQDGGQQ
ncbi:hypothetical protein [Kitasatospora sp. A2-31]|uniref:hypothetical protein n=1 Tax=Kitasatospora sp. A2-31 TaxID=2916414 RepID=UPI001EE7FC24|nr:hypothetical protein [Kitasatospora sp. A2-31]MCG6493404.1 hypothetical protein [Kitasatospora sp. A2-31]